MATEAKRTKWQLSEMMLAVEFATANHDEYLVSISIEIRGKEFLICAPI